MAEFIVMPKMGFDMREGELNQWLYEIGSQVNKGDIVAEIESDKATLELESHVTGILLATLASAGDIVAVGENVAIVGEAGEVGHGRIHVRKGGERVVVHSVEGPESAGLNRVGKHVTGLETYVGGGVPGGTARGDPAGDVVLRREKMWLKLSLTVRSS